MSLWSKIAKGAGAIIGGAVGGPIGAGLGAKVGSWAAGRVEAGALRRPTSPRGSYPVPGPGQVGGGVEITGPYSISAFESLAGRPPSGVEHEQLKAAGPNWISVAQSILGIIGGAGQVTQLFPRSAAPSNGGGGCGCNGGSSGRDPCTHQRMTSQPAPLATFFGGCCPPGRTLRRINNGRDICIKTPKMNPMNPAALARADRRITAFASRARPILKDLGFTVGTTRHKTLKPAKRGRRR